MLSLFTSAYLCFVKLLDPCSSKWKIKTSYIIRYENHLRQSIVFIEICYIVLHLCLPCACHASALREIESKRKRSDGNNCNISQIQAHLSIRWNPHVQQCDLSLEPDLQTVAVSAFPIPSASSVPGGIDQALLRQVRGCEAALNPVGLLPDHDGKWSGQLRPVSAL